MLIALLLADKNGPDAEAYFAPASAPKKKTAAESASVIEQTASAVLRGPFGGTLLAAHPSLKKRVREALSGFTIQFVDVPPTATTQPEILFAGLAASAAFREKWERVRTAASARFDKEKSASEWGKHKQNADVKIRGLASSFDRDGILLLPADAQDIRSEDLASAVERFARDGQSAQPHAFAQGIKDGVRGWPALATLQGAQELSQNLVHSDIQAWLLKNVSRVLDLKV